MEIIQYPHPTLRKVSKPLKRFDAALREMVREMFQLMYAAKGVGLAANQVNLPLRFFVTNLEADPAKKELERVYINPVISGRKGLAEAEEGCLSLPGLYAQVGRSERVTIHAYDLAGNEVRQEVDGLLARVVQHETDHLDGVLFIDRLSMTAGLAAKASIEDFETIYQGRIERGEAPGEKEITAHWRDWESRYC